MSDSPKPLVRLVGVSKTFREAEREHCVLRALDLEIARGQFVALVGRSGSGKSTLLNLISGIDAPDAGQVIIADQSLSSMSERNRTLFRRRHIGFVFQFFNLIPTLTVVENLLLPLELNRRTGPQATSQALALLEQVKLGGRQASYPDRLSGGEQQRVAIARALAHSPALVLADEPTGNLDRETGDRVMELLMQMHRRLETTMVLVTHSVEVAARADRVLRLHDGTVRESRL